MNSQSQYISIFEKSSGSAFDVAHTIEPSDAGYLAVANSSYEGLERSCRELGRPTLVVINQSLIHDADELSYLKSVLSSSGVLWLAVEGDDMTHSTLNIETHKVNGFRHANLRLKEFLNAGTPILAEQGGNSLNQLCGYGIPTAEVETPTVRVALTPRQEQIYGLVLRGLSNKGIARALGITESTVKEHITGILQRLGLKTRIEALSRALVPQQ